MLCYNERVFLIFHDEQEDSMTTIENKRFDEERALYGSNDLRVINCRFEGPADGESALKECRHIQAEGCLFHLRYPFWHDEALCIRNCEMTEGCRAALWYSSNIDIWGSRLHGIKALRECRDVRMEDCDVISPEFGWSVQRISMHRCTVQGEYFMLRASDLRFTNVSLKGKYSFQYIENAVFEGCELDTKDAFWHARNVTVRNSVIRGEYLAWYCENVTFDHCTIIGTQPLCYCRGLKLIDCEMRDADLCFEKSEVEATLTAPVLSVKNVLRGHVYAPAILQTVWDDPAAQGQLILTVSGEENTMPKNT